MFMTFSSKNLIYGSLETRCYAIISAVLCLGGAGALANLNRTYYNKYVVGHDDD